VNGKSFRKTRMKKSICRSTGDHEQNYTT
jgi:hypothetical protein